MKRFVLYIFGLFIGAFGVAFAIQSNLGLSPMNSLPYVLSHVLGMNMGNVVIALLALYILIQMVILRKDFKWIDTTQILFSFIFGYFVDFTRFIVGDMPIASYTARLGMLLVSIVLIATGITLFMKARLVNLPSEGLIAAISFKVGKPFGTVAITVHTLTVLLGILVSFTFLGRVAGIGVGTILSALLIGKLIPIVGKKVDPLLVRIGI
ncbi:MAG: DUF6198 family protein [Turicibacter sp.]|nr:DUF6198 family protein [Turicibacter sp.]